MDRLHLDIENTNGIALLPQALVERCAKLNAKAGLINLACDKLEKIVETSAKVEETIGELERNFKGLRAEIADNEKTFGKSETFGKFLAEIGDLETQLARYQGAHTQAATSNAELNRVLNANLLNVTQLGRPLDELQSSLPPLATSGGECCYEYIYICILYKILLEAKLLNTQRAVKLRK